MPDPKEIVIPPMTAVESSRISAIGHDGNSLFVQFRNKGGPGATYSYPNFPADKFSEFMTAESKGAFFTQHVRPLTDYARVAEPPKEAA